jgi:hypothetical protein
VVVDGSLLARPCEPDVQPGGECDRCCAKLAGLVACTLSCHLADTAWAWSMLEAWFITAETNVFDVGRAVRHRGESAVGIGARAASGGVGG